MLEKKRFIVTHFRSKDVTMDTSYIYSNFWRRKLVEINLLLERGFAFQILSIMKAFFLEHPIFFGWSHFDNN
jgi:hypothetical protein